MDRVGQHEEAVHGLLRTGPLEPSQAEGVEGGERGQVAQGVVLDQEPAPVVGRRVPVGDEGRERDVAEDARRDDDQMLDRPFIEDPTQLARQEDVCQGTRDRQVLGLGEHGVVPAVHVLALEPDEPFEPQALGVFGALPIEPGQALDVGLAAADRLAGRFARSAWRRREPRLG